MTTQTLVIIDTGCANISSVKFAFERLNIDVTVSDDHQVIKAADKVLLPGVGSAQAAMNAIQEKQLYELIRQLKQPVLGICLGMQLLTRASEETPGSHIAENRTTLVDCLDLIPTEIKRMETGDLVLPHMGWNQVTPENDNPLFKNIDSGNYFYFVHSFAAPISDNTIARCDYGSEFSAAIANDNFFGVQFHPERSGDAGAQLLKNFVEM